MNFLKRSGLLCVVPLILLMAFYFTPPTQADKVIVSTNPIVKIDLTAAEYLKDYFAWCSTKDGIYNYFLAFAAVSNNANGVASYSEGTLKNNADQATLAGQGTQYYNYRRWGGILNPYPFDVKQTDPIQLTITKGGLGTITNQVSNNKGTVNIPFHSENNLLYGFTTQGFPTYWTISLKKMRLAIVK